VIRPNASGSFSGRAKAAVVVDLRLSFGAHRVHGEWSPPPHGRTTC